MTSSYLILEAQASISGTRYNTIAGERRRIRYGYIDPTFVPEIVKQVRKGEGIDWGGAFIQPRDYRVLFDGPGPLPPEYAYLQIPQEPAPT